VSNEFSAGTVDTSSAESTTLPEKKKRKSEREKRIKKRKKIRKREGKKKERSEQPGPETRFRLPYTAFRRRSFSALSRSAVAPQAG
jgi:hypothetical protein